MRKWLRSTGVLSKHINAQGFQHVELVDPVPFSLTASDGGPVVF